MNDLSHIARVSEKLYIGDLQVALNQKLLQSFNITKVLSLDTVKPVLDENMDQLFISVSDEVNSDILSGLPAALDFLSGDVCALVHCRHGVSRSAAVVIAWIMQRDKIPVESALQKLVLVREQCLPNEGFMQQLELFHMMGCKVDRDSPAYINFALQHGQVKLSDVAPGEKAVFKCKKCRKILSSTNHVLEHKEGEFPDWRGIIPGLGVLTCRYGVIVVPPWWLEQSGIHDWYMPNKLQCYGCGTKVGCWGLASCGCGARGGRGVVLNLNRVDKSGGIYGNIRSIPII